jgi:hypothetical protein
MDAEDRRRIRREYVNRPEVINYDMLMDVLHFLGRFKVVGYEIKNTGMNTLTNKSTHILTIKLAGFGDSKW